MVSMELLAEEIKKLDPKGEIVTFSPNADFTAGSIAYQKDSGVTLGENVTRLKMKEYIRAWLVVRLIRLFKYPAYCIDIHTPTPSVGLHPQKRRSMSESMTNVAATWSFWNPVEPFPKISRPLGFAGS
jgi:hypothetical protein